MATLENTAIMFEARLRGRISEILRPRLGEYSCAKLMSDPRRRPVRPYFIDVVVVELRFNCNSISNNSYW